MFNYHLVVFAGIAGNRTVRSVLRFSGFTNADTKAMIERRRPLLAVAGAPPSPLQLYERNKVLLLFARIIRKHLGVMFVN